MARALAALVLMVLPCAALNSLNWRLLPSSEPAGQQAELDAGLDSVVMMQTVATPLKEQEGFAHFAFDDDLDDQVVLTAPAALGEAAVARRSDMGGFGGAVLAYLYGLTGLTQPLPTSGSTGQSLGRPALEAMDDSELPKGSKKIVGSKIPIGTKTTGLVELGSKKTLIASGGKAPIVPDDSRNKDKDKDKSGKDKDKDKAGKDKDKDKDKAGKANKDKDKDKDKLKKGKKTQKWGKRAARATRARLGRGCSSRSGVATGTSRSTSLLTCASVARLVCTWPR
ncbi:unnamed protein product [Prorocentrum cordatum]|uniref:Uncharacterized protein n=1 Tax=Prorocentrum cordatum TaxID=2364126 RepID=A0ABN9VQT8_9DINO|nr:unnamed protein product [Polarella glacialis]